MVLVYSKLMRVILKIDLDVTLIAGQNRACNINCCSDMQIIFPLVKNKEMRII